MNFNEFKTLICVGSGGVGKTSVSAAMAMMAANQGQRVLVMTIDPSKRLKTSLGLEDTNGEIVEVNISSKGKLYACILNAEKIFEEFIISSASEKSQADRLLKNRLYQQLSTTLSGSQEFTSLLQLAKVLESNEYDLVILDTPPAQHAIEFLEAPGKLQKLFQESVIKWFIGEESVGIIRRLISKSTKLVLSALERVTGSQFMQELSDFFESVQSLQGNINLKTQKVQQLLVSDNTGFILVTSFDEVKLKEARELGDFLYGQKYKLVLNIINRAFPVWYESKSKQATETVPEGAVQWVKYYKEKAELYDRILTDQSHIQQNIQLADHSIDMSGLDAIGVLANEIDSKL